jgi:hypothetical protein
LQSKPGPREIWWPAVELTSRNELLAFIRRHRLAVVVTVAENGAPQAAVVGIDSALRFGKGIAAHEGLLKTRRR